jgi:hypothetical protein
MTESSAQALQAGVMNAPHRGATNTAAVRDGVDRVAPVSLGIQRACAPVRQSMTLVSVLRHVLAMDKAAVPSSNPGTLVEAADLSRMNALISTSLDTCVCVDTARRQLQNAISTQRDMETVLEMLAARVEIGQASQAEHRRVSTQVTFAYDKVSEAVSEWNRIGRHFTQLTRLLPAQLEPVSDMLSPILPDEMDRLAQACLNTRVNVYVSLRQRALARQRSGSLDGHEPGPEQFNTWVSYLEHSRSQGAAAFAAAREAYLQSTLDLDQAQACHVRARSLRRTAETGFRYGPRSALHFAEAILEESQRMHAVLALQSTRLAAKHQLFVLAGVLLPRLGLVGPQNPH